MYVLDELALPDSNTWAACEAFLDRIGRWSTLSPHTTQIRVYGDASGQGRHTAASRTDWQIVREFFGRYPYRVSFHLPSSNPPDWGGVTIQRVFTALYKRMETVNTPRPNALRWTRFSAVRFS